MNGMKWLCVLVALLVSGCQQRSTVSGVVHLDGQLVNNAEITFKRVGADDLEEYSTDIVNGRFEFSKSPLVGRYYVILKAKDVSTGEMVTAIQEGRGMPSPKSFIPKTYEEPGPLKVEVKPDSPNFFPLKLKSFSRSESEQEEQD